MISHSPKLLPGFMISFTLAVQAALLLFPVEAGSAVNVYVPGLGNDVTVVDTSTNTIVTTIPGFTSASGSAVSPDGSRVYVTDLIANELYTVDASTNTIIASVPIPVPDEYGIAPIVLSPDGETAYVGYGPDDNNDGYAGVYVVDTATLDILDNFTDTSYDGGGYLAITPTVHSSIKMVVTIRVIPPFPRITGSVTLISTPGFPEGAVVSPDGAEAYLLSGEYLEIVDTSSNAVVGSISLAAYPVAEGIVVTPDGTTAYVSTVGVGPVPVVVIDLSTSTVLTTVSLTNGGWGLRSLQMVARSM